MIKNFLSLFAVFFAFGVGAQEMHFSGFVNDTINDRPLEYAMIMAVRVDDGKLMGFTRSEADGSFELTGVPIDTMELVVSHYNFDEKRYYIVGSQENDSIHIPNVVLPEESTELDEVVVYANKKPIYFRGDTMVYVADSFATRENAMVEDLIKNLPGLEVDDDGNISTQGRQIEKVLVDGDEFFGDDPTIATRNLQAEGVDKVEVYETEDENSGGNSDEKIKVLDVKLKEDAKKGYFGKIAGAGGADSEYLTDQPDGTSFYSGELLANYFNKDLKVSVFALGSNTPNTGFSYRDASRFGLTNELSGGWRSMANSSRLNGLPENYKGGFYYSDKWGDNFKVNLNYTYNDSRLTTDQQTNQEYFLTDTTYSSASRNEKYQKQLAHTINFSFEYAIDSMTQLNVKSNITQRNEEIDENNSTNFFAASGDSTNATNVTNESEADGLEGNVDAKLVRKFAKEDRELSLQYQLGYTETDRENFMQSNILSFTQSVPDSSFDQKRDIENRTTGHRALFDYTEPLTRKIKLNFQYKLDYFFGSQATLTYDRTGQSYDSLSTVYSNDFSNTRLENRIGVSLRYTDRRHSLNTGTRLRNVVIDNENNFTNNVIEQDVDNILPYIEYTYKWSNSHRLRFNYRTSSSQPSISQLQPVRDNTNPNRQIIGNPDLVPNYSHRVNLRYNKWNALKQSYIWSNAYMNYTNNAFSSAINYLPDGRTVAQSINVDGNINAGLYAGGGFPIFKDRLQIRPNVNAGYNRTNSVINGMDHTTENSSVGGGLKIGLRSDTLEVGLSANGRYNNPSSSLSFGANQPYFQHSYGLDVFVELPFDFFIESDANYTINAQRADGYNISPFILNGKINKRFLETGNLVAHVEVNDIFNQNVGVGRSIGDNVITDRRNRIIARYFMVGLTWRFNNNNTKAHEGNGH